MQLFVVFYFSFQKEGYFIDEIFSYSLANSYYNINHNFELSLYDRWIETEDLNELIVVAEEHRFAYDSVYINQAYDVHPPFYYFILHSISSFFPENFSKWFGLTINILFFVVCSIFLFSLSKKLVDNEFVALLPCVFWGFSIGAINTVTFIRMYMMLTVFVTLFVYQHIGLLENGLTRKKKIKIIIITLLGFLTHYYFLVFCFIWAVVFVGVLLVKGERKTASQYLFPLLVSFLVGIILFPFSIVHIFLSYHGVGVIESNLNVRRIFSNLPIMFDLLSRELFSGALIGLLIILTGLMLIIMWIERKGSKSKENSFKFKINAINDISTKELFVFLITFTVISTFIVISIISPYRTTRYLFFIYPLISLIFLFYTYKVFSRIFKNKWMLFASIFSLFFLIIITSHNMQSPMYLYSGTSNNLSTLQHYDMYDGIYITDRAWIISSNIFDLLELKRMYVVGAEDAPALLDEVKETGSRDGIIVFLDKENHNILLSNESWLNHYQNTVRLYSTSYSDVYLLERKLD